MCVHSLHHPSQNSDTLSGKQEFLGGMICGGGQDLVLDLLWQPWNEGPGATEDSSGHCWVGSGPRDPHTRSRMFHPGPPLASCLLSSSFSAPQMQTNNCSAVGHPIKILCQLSSIFRLPLATGRALGCAKAQVHPCGQDAQVESLRYLRVGTRGLA